MRTNKLFGFLLSMGLLLTACGISQPQIVTIEVTRIVRKNKLVHLG
jgi:hypothetical protein